MTSSASYLLSSLPREVWLEFSTRHEGHPLLDEHETILRELSALTEIAKEHHGVELRFVRVKLWELEKEFQSVVRENGEIDEEAVWACMNREVQICEELVETVRQIIMSSRDQASQLVLKLNPPSAPNPKPRSLRTSPRDPKAQLLSFRRELPFRYTSEFDGGAVQKVMEERWRQEC